MKIIIIVFILKRKEEHIGYVPIITIQVTEGMIFQCLQCVNAESQKKIISEISNNKKIKRIKFNCQNRSLINILAEYLILIIII